jgi:dTDP-4-amino-4,6-dideoxygalactose transaminase
LWWSNLTPVFVDIEPNFLNLDPEKIEKAVTKKTTAILPVHVYGNPCEVQRIGKIAKKHNLALIYDAAHAFGVKFKGNSVLNFGDISVLSFHATKVFNTIEGGAVITKSRKIKKRIDFLKNFGITGETKVKEAGINAKMNEMQAAMGLLQLKYIDKNIRKRKAISRQYRDKLRDIPGINLLNNLDTCNYNYSHFPIFIKEKLYGMSRDLLYAKLKKNSILVRRYFYPLTSHFCLYKKLVSLGQENLPVAEQAAKEVICLPIYPELTKKQIEKVIKVIKG